MEVSEAQRLKSLEDENRRLKHLVADLSLDKEVLKAVISKNGWSSQLNGASAVPNKAADHRSIEQGRAHRLDSPRAVDRIPAPSAGFSSGRPIWSSTRRATFQSDHSQAEGQQEYTAWLGNCGHFFTYSTVDEKARTQPIYFTCCERSGKLLPPSAILYSNAVKGGLESRRKSPKTISAPVIGSLPIG